jgi:hypothetical protein
MKLGMMETKEKEKHNRENGEPQDETFMGGWK